MARMVPHPGFPARVSLAVKRGTFAAGRYYLGQVADAWSRPGHGTAYEIRTSKTGKQYWVKLPDAATSSMQGAFDYKVRRGHTRGGGFLFIHIASAPGEPPAVLTQMLALSVGQYVTVSGTPDFPDVLVGFGSSLKVGKGKEWNLARVLEKGTKDGKIQPRPMWGPKLVESFPTMLREFCDEARKTLRGAA